MGAMDSLFVLYPLYCVAHSQRLSLFDRGSWNLRKAPKMSLAKKELRMADREDSHGF